MSFESISDKDEFISFLLYEEPSEKKGIIQYEFFRCLIVCLFYSFKLNILHLSNMHDETIDSCLMIFRESYSDVAPSDGPFESIGRVRDEINF